MSFRALGLDRDADELAVRRAYARLLKQNRPDDDPVAFQRLNEAYQSCLAQVRQRQWEAPEPTVEGYDEDDRDDVLSGYNRDWPAPDPVQPTSGTTPSQPTTDLPPVAHVSESYEEAGDSFELTTFLDSLLEQIDREPAAGVMAWLTAQPALYSIRLKSAITVDVLAMMTEREPPIPIDTLNVIADFFSAGSLGPRDWWLVEQLEACRVAARTLEQFRRGDLPRAPGEAAPREFDKLIDREIAQPRWRWRVLGLLLLPGLPSRIHNRIIELDQLTGGTSVGMTNPPLTNLVAQLADRTRINPLRIGLTWLRVVVFTALIMGMVYVFNGNVLHELIEVGLIAGAIFTGWQIGMAAYLWIRRQVEVRGHAHLLREVTSVLLVVAALVSDALIPSMPRSVGYWLVFIALWRAVTVQRFAYGYALVVMFAFADWGLNRLGAYPALFSPVLLGLSATTIYVLALDRLDARRRALPVEVAVLSVDMLKRGCWIALASLSAALAFFAWIKP